MLTGSRQTPFLITHGANDRQINVDHAHQSYEQFLNSPRREPDTFTDREGGEHVGALAPSRGVSVSDIVALEFGGDNDATIFVAGNDPNE